MRFLSRSVILSVCAALVLSCTTPPPASVPEGTSPAELVQMAQDASERGKSERAIQYYQTILDRFPNDLPSVCAAEYEIAFLRYKAKDYEKAKALFTSLLARYKSPDAALLPAQYKVLGEKILAKIEQGK